MAKVFFTSDTHFNHRAMIEKAWRPMFSSVDEMNEEIIANWNLAVRPDDTVWHLGDFAMGNDVAARSLVALLNGHKHLVTGNHDHAWSANRDSAKYQRLWLDAGFESVQAFARRKIEGHSVMLSHFPYEGDHLDEARFDEYRLRDAGKYLIHGHVHESWKVNGRQINVGVDVWNFHPVELTQIEEYIRGHEAL